MARANYFSECGGVTVGAVSGKSVRYPAGVFEAEVGDLRHCAEVQDFEPSKNGVHYEAAKAAGLNPEAEGQAYPTASMKAAKPRRNAKKQSRSDSTR